MTHHAAPAPVQHVVSQVSSGRLQINAAVYTMAVRANYVDVNLWFGLMSSQMTTSDKKSDYSPGTGWILTETAVKSSGFTIKDKPGKPYLSSK